MRSCSCGGRELQTLSRGRFLGSISRDSSGDGGGGDQWAHSFTGNVIRYETFLLTQESLAPGSSCSLLLFLPPSKSYFTFHMDNITNTLESPEHYLQEQLYSLPFNYPLSELYYYYLEFYLLCLLKCNCLTTYTLSHFIFQCHSKTSSSISITWFT